MQNLKGKKIVKPLRRMGRGWWKTHCQIPRTKKKCSYCGYRRGHNIHCPLEGLTKDAAAQVISGS